MTINRRYPMTLPLLPWAMAALLGVVAADGVNATDDPYRWLEEVTGDEASGLGQGAERREHRAS